MRVLADHERFEKLASGIQSLAVAVAVIVGGLWTGWTFYALKSSEKALSELEKTKLELEVQSLRRPVLELSIGAEVLPHVRNIEEAFRYKIGLLGQKLKRGAPKRHVHVTVTIKNNGNRDAVLDTSKDTLFVRRLRSELGSIGEGFQYVGKGYRFRGIDNDPKSVSVLPSHHQELHYIVEVEEENIYQFEFSVPGDNESAGQFNFEVITGTQTKGGGTTWSAVTFLAVPRAARKP